MPDFNYWKDKYKHSWEESAKREHKVAKLLESMFDGRIKVEFRGLGAGQSEYLPGNATQHGHEKGDPDIFVVGTNVYLEITGPLTTSVDEHQPLWIRLDKVQNAQRKREKEHEVWLVHHLPRNDLLRTVALDIKFFNALQDGEFPIVNPKIRGAEEKYYSIPANHHCVGSIDVLIERLTRGR